MGRELACLKTRAYFGPLSSFFGPLTSEPMLNRRNFFRAALGELTDAIGEFQEGTRYQLSELFTLEDHQIASLKPMIYPEVVIEEKDGMLVGFTLEDDLGTPLFEASDMNKAMIASFDGMKTLNALAMQFSRQFDMEQEAAFDQTKKTFFTLVRHSISTNA